MTSRTASDLPTGPSTRRLLVFLFVLFLVALIPRAAYQASLSGSPFWTVPILDEAVNHDWAASLATGAGGLGELPFFRAPLYPWLLGLTYSAVGVEPQRARLLQAILSSLTCVLAGWVAWQAFGRLAGWCAGFLAAGYWPWIYFDAELQDVALSLFWNLGALAVLISWVPGKGSRWRPLAAGLLLGLSVITRPTVLVAVPAILAWLLFPDAQDAPRRGMNRRRLQASALLIVGVLIAMAPVALLNRIGGRDSVLVASQGGMNFYIGNHAGSDGHSARFPGARADFPSMVDASRRQAEASRGKTLRDSEVSNHWYLEAFDFWRREPVAALALSARKVGYLLSAAELPNNKQIRFVLERFAPWLGFPLAGFALVLGLGVVGCVWGGGGRRAALLVAFSLSYAIAVVAFFVTARFRMPVVAVWIVLAGGGLAMLIREARQKAWRSLALPALMLMVITAGATLASRGFTENQAHGHYTLGRAYRQTGDDRSAEEAFRRALEAEPAFSEAALSLSALLLETDRPREAAGLLETVVASDPGDRRSLWNYSLALRASGRPQAAVTMLRQAVQAQPGLTDLWVWLGDAEMAAGDPASSLLSFGKALTLEPKRSDARFHQANAMTELARHDEAVAGYRTLLAADPEHLGAWSGLGIALSSAGDLFGSAAAFAEAARLAPADARTHLNLGRAWDLLGDRTRALAFYRKALQVAGPDDETGRLARQALQEAAESY